MFQIEFERTIESELSTEELWRLLKQAFEGSQSPIWPRGLEEVDTFQMRPGAKVISIYKLGPLHLSSDYKITKFHSGHSFSYESAPHHPLKGGATVKVEPRIGGRSALRWRGAYTPRLHPMALGAFLYVRLYFMRTFFRRLEERLHSYEAGLGFDETAEARSEI